MFRINQPGAGVMIADAALSLTGFPAAGDIGVLPSAWTGLDTNEGAVPEFDLAVWANLPVDLTAAHLYGAALKPFVNADDEFTAEADTEIFTAATHGLVTGDGPFQVSNAGGALPAGLLAATDYWVIRIDANTFYLATSLANALTGTNLAITTDGTGTQTIADTADTQRVHWQDYGLLGPAGDGLIELDEQLSYVVRASHHPKTIAYALIATMSVSDPEAVSAAVYPITER